jgi:hypothetical protein
MSLAKLRKSFATDKTIEDDGAWIAVDDGIKFRVRRANSARAIELRANIEKDYLRHKIRATGEYPKEISEEMGNKFIAQAYLAGWSGVTEDDGTEIKYSPNRAVELIKEIPDLGFLILQEATNRGNFKADEKKEMVGN